MIGCDDRIVVVDRDDNLIYWRNDISGDLLFAIPEYTVELECASTDYGWESIGRTEERLVNAALAGRKTSDGYLFQWSSTRIRSDMITLCFERNGDQQLFDLCWSGRADEDLVTTARRSVR